MHSSQECREAFVAEYIELKKSIFMEGINTVAKEKQLLGKRSHEDLEFEDSADFEAMNDRVQKKQKTMMDVFMTNNFKKKKNPQTTDVMDFKNIDSMQAHFHDQYINACNRKEDEVNDKISIADKDAEILDGNAGLESTIRKHNDEKRMPFFYEPRCMALQELIVAIRDSDVKDEVKEALFTSVYTLWDLLFESEGDIA